MTALGVLVAGGGIGGLATALCLAKAGHRVTVFEQAAEFDEAGAGIQLSPNCTRILHELGLQDALRTCASVPEAAEFRDGRTGTVIATLPLGDAALERYGMPYYHIHRSDLQGILLAAARRAGASLRPGSRVDSVSLRRTCVAVSVDGAEWSGDVLVGADGIHSTIRASLWGADRPRFTGNVAWRALVPASSLPRGTDRPVTTAWLGRRRHFVHYHVRSGTLVNLVGIVEKADWRLESWAEPGEHAELKADFTGWHADIQRLIDHVDPETLFKWALYDRAPMRGWSQDHVALLGDACHPTLPFMAQGAAMAIEDAAVLSACLTAGHDVRGSLRRYEHLRRKRATGVQRGSRRNATLYHLPGVAALIRNVAIRGGAQRVMDGLYSYDALDAANT